MLICMITDHEHPEFRARAVQEILRIRAAVREKERMEEEGTAVKKRGRKPKKLLVRQFKKVKEINLEAASYPDLIDWSTIEDLEPPLTKHISDEDLHHFVEDWNYLKLPHVPNHTQQIERMVGIISNVVARYKTKASRRAQIFLKLSYNKRQVKKAAKAKLSRSSQSSTSSQASSVFF